MDAGYSIQAVFTHADDPGENRFYASVAQLCARHGIPVHAPQDASHPLWVQRIRALRPDFIFSFYYRKLLSGGGARLRQPGRLQPARLAVAALSGARTGQLGAGQRRAGNRRHAAPHGRAARRRADRGAAQCAHCAGRYGSDAARQSCARRRAQLLADCLPSLARGELAERPQDETPGQLLRPAHARGRRTGLEPAGGGAGQPGACGDTALSRRLRVAWRSQAGRLACGRPGHRARQAAGDCARHAAAAHRMRHRARWRSSTASRATPGCISRARNWPRRWG